MSMFKILKLWGEINILPGSPVVNWTKTYLMGWVKAFPTFKFSIF